MKQSWKNAPTMPHFLAVAVRKGLTIADSIGVEEANDKSWLTIKFTKSKSVTMPNGTPACDAVGKRPTARRRATRGNTSS